MELEIKYNKVLSIQNFIVIKQIIKSFIKKYTVMKKKYCLLIFNIVLLNSCAFDPKREPMLTVKNNTKDVIYIYYSSKESLQLQPELKLEISKHAFAYTDENGNDHSTVVYPENRVDSFSYTYFHDDGLHSKGKFKPFPNKNYVNFFFIKESTMRSYTWKEICEKQLYEKKVKYSYKELEKLHYRILYKP